ncbi:amino acid adenylation domain-containing protein [Pseudomonas sp. BF61]|uniref:non-ribosomal peptide synthetase n=1 Tax=Pseudomonas sp. BF61 TaxID=2741068 RepID=UPI001C0C8371|nr:non-ribosomal peptide synthetase [Pseudomonas sp. BF61]MBU4630248.1 amino acid adenylation domain-containing protein [Pseudomonas sp. BF61]
MNQLNQLPDDDLLALLLADEAGAGQSIQSLAGRDPVPLSFAQQRLWFLQQFDPQSHAYNLPRAIAIKGPVDACALEAALNQVINRHDILRTAFRNTDGTPLQVIDQGAQLNLLEEDLSALDSVQREQQVQDRIRQHATQPFDLSQAPLIRSTLLKRATQDYVLLLNMHHIVSDAWSNPILMHDLASALGQPGRALPRPSIQYADYAQWQRQDYPLTPQHAAAAQYWKAILGNDIPALTLPRERLENHAGAGHHAHTLPAHLNEQLQSFCQQQGLTPFVVLLGTWQLLLGRYSGQTDFTVGVPNATRNQAQIQDLVGFFVSSQVYRARLAPEQSCSAFLQALRQQSLAALEHADYPIELILEDLHLQRSPQANPLFQTLFNWRAGAAQDAPLHLGPLQLTFMDSHPLQAKFDLSLDVEYSQQQITAHFDYDAGCFTPATIATLAGHWQNLLQAMVEQPQALIGELAMLSDEERERQLGQWNTTAVHYPNAAPVHVLVAEQAERLPHAVAVVLGEQQLTLDQLNRRANQLAHKLLELGVGPNVCVGLGLERSLEMVIALLAVLKAGGAYVPLDPAYPADRLAYMINDSGIGLLLTQSSLALPAPDSLPSLCLDQDSDWLEGYDSANPQLTVSADNLAYMIYTSGSTGQPKGVQVRHGALTNHMLWMQGELGLNAADRVLQKTAFSFDASVWEFWLPLLHGAQLVLASRELSDDLSVLWSEVAAQRISVLQMAPSLLQALLVDEQGAQMQSLRLLLLGGEALGTPLVAQLRERWNGRLCNLYGPTEATIDTTFFDVASLPEGAIAPIGRPLANVRTYLLDHDLQLCPVGTSAELLIGGDSLAQGYHQRPGLTAERFIPDPFAGNGARLYRSGDLTRYRADGVIDYIGRIDHQVKIRGLRIELGEIEAQLLQHKAVREAVVIAHPTPGGPQLVGYVVPTEPATDINRQDALREVLKAWLGEQLPDYMVPGHLLILAQLPLTPNGKLDRKALPAPDASQALHAYVAPQNDLQQRIAAIWQDVLKLAKIGLNDNFFELGGDSIISIQVVSRARQAGIHFTPKDLFQHQTIQGLASVAKTHGQGLAIDQGPVTGSAPLLPIQHLFFDTEIPERHHWNQSVLLKPATALDPHLLEQALNALIQHHDALRLSFTQADSGWNAEYRPATASVLWQTRIEDTTQLQSLGDEAQRSLNLQDGPLLRAVLVSLGDGSQRLLLAIHHLVVDGVSWRILFDDLQTVYRQVQAGQAIELPEKTSAYKTWGERLRGYGQSAELQQELMYWEQQLDAASHDLPQSNPDGSQQHSRSTTVDILLSKTLTQQLLQVAPAAYRTQINDLLLTALTRAVSQWTTRDNVLIQLESHGREPLFDDIDLTRTIGWFTSLYPVKLSAHPDLGEAIKQVKEQLRAIPDKGIGFGVLRYLGDAQTRERLSALPVPRITFNYLGQFDGSFDSAEGALFVPTGEERGAEKSSETPLGNWLTINSQVYGSQLSVSWTFSDDVFPVEVIQNLANNCLHALEQLIGYCCDTDHQGATPSDFPLAGLSQAQLDTLSIPVQQIEDIYPLSPMQEGLLVHTLLEKNSGIYFMQECYTIKETLDYPRFEAAWQQVVKRYEAIRASFLWNTGGTLLQVIHKNSNVQVERLDLSHVPMDRVQAQIEHLLKVEREAGFDLALQPPIRFKLILLADHSHRFVMSNHHILLDAWCRSLLMSDFFEIYHAMLAGKPCELATPYRFRDFIQWLQQQDRTAATTFWQDQLEGLEHTTSLPVDHPQVPAHSVSVIGDNYTWLSQQDSTALQEAATRHHLTLNTFVQAAWALTLHNHSRSRDVVFGVTVSGRPAHIPEMQNTVGLFINSVPLRVAIPTPDSQLSTLAWLQTILHKNVSLREYDYLPLVNIQECSQILKGQPLFNSLFVYENAPMEDSVGQDAQDMGVISDSSRTHTNYPVTVVVYPSDKVGLHLSYDTRFFEQSTMDSLLEEFKQWLIALRHHLHQPLAQITLVAPERLSEWALEHNQSQVPHDLQRSFVEQFEQHVDASPQRVAAVCQDRAWTYEQLDHEANILGHRLIERGVGLDQPVALLADRDLELLAMIVGTFKAGAGYLPLDPSHPGERIKSVLRLSKTPLLVCTAKYREQAQMLLGELAISAPEHSVGLLVWEDLPPDLANRQRPGRYSGPNNLAYVIFTSGSTGQPKGVMVEQAGMLNNQLSKVPYLQLTEQDIIAQTASQSFDISVWQFLTALLCGAKVCIFADDISKNPQALLKHVEEQRITVLEIVPALIQALLIEQHSDLPDLRWLLPTGEALPAETAADWLARYPAIKLVNAYGPAECSDDVAFYNIDPASTQRTYIPIGYPTDNNRLYVLDDDLSPIPTGATGEICIAGVGVGRGYCGDPVRTAASFVPNPFALIPGERLYKSGDLARRRKEDGALEYLGRVDQQVKIYGFRIELGEIEAQIALFPGVREAAVLVGENPLGKQLIAYLTLEEGDTHSGIDALRAFLKARLPAYMIPAQVHVLEQMPRNPNGKLDRKALACVDVQSEAQEHREPQSGLQSDIADIWRAVLKTQRIGLDDNFFALGGNSLLATQVTSRVHLHLGIEVPLATIFESASLQDYASRIEPAGEQAPDDSLNDLFDLLDVLETQ